MKITIIYYDYDVLLLVQSLKHSTSKAVLGEGVTAALKEVVTKEVLEEFVSRWE